MNLFNHWYEEWADIPTKSEDGTWYDAETGFTYADFVKGWEEQNKPARKAPVKISAKGAGARAIAKKFGGKALTGTAKQKEWAEQIRANLVSNVDEYTAKQVCDHNSRFTKAKWWIENREKTPKQFEEFIAKRDQLLKEHEIGQANEDLEEVTRTAFLYNELSSNWS